MKGSVLVSGGSGFLGSALVSELLERGYAPIYILMRGANARACEERVRKLWWEQDALRNALGTHIVAVPADITQEHLGLSETDYAELAAKTTFIVHAAAEIGVNETAQQFGAVNIDGTANMLAFAHAAKEAGGIKRFVHISTAYVAGDRRGVIFEDELNTSRFNSLYEQSKYGAEQLVREQADHLPINIVRPAQIVGDTRTGFVSTFNTLYYPLKLYLKGRLHTLPVKRTMKVNLVPVDYVARITAEVMATPHAQGKTFHAVLPAHAQPTVEELLDFVRAWAQEHLEFDPGRVRFVHLPGASRAGQARNMAAKDTAKKKGSFQNMLALAPYFAEDKLYNTRNTDTLLKVEAPTWQSFMPQLLEYATRKNFLNHTSRNVFEQMLVRMASKRNTIDYFDVSSEGIHKTSGEDVRAEIIQTARALQAAGIHALDRVALVGVNSVRYFIADAAIGLAGATSVPLYYTLPAQDIASLVETSKAQLIFVGSEKLLDRLPTLLHIPIVSFHDQPRDGVQSWHTFQARGAMAHAGQANTPAPHGANATTSNHEAAAPAQDPLTSEFGSPALSDLATIRYTSGTTGKPKGVTFDHFQLRWMGEVMPTLLDWKTRNSKLRYLSFLPMSHVVEGILVSYAPYYILEDIEMYYLNDFPLLAEMLSQVRPTIFFSVPRFYEKVWNQFEASNIGKRYLRMPEGPTKRALAKVARAGLLRKAGLDKCRQLIVGSAQVSIDLLESFRALGIEIHNAYGVTEAPLITLSRLGHNELGSTGDLLPETHVSLTNEGEILVAGPQVTRGYDGDGSCLNEQGAFATGDFGSYSPQGKLVIGGRKKELLVTSYGKNISPEKVETLLKSIPGVSEALLVGEGKPYVAALLWMEEDAPAFDGAALDAAVHERNTQLSHPEQLKRWAVVDKPLSIAEGELTPNLKLRRKNVAERYAETIDGLYADDFTTRPLAHILHKGAQ